MYIAQIAKFMGPTWGPPGSRRPQMCPMLAPWTLLSGINTVHHAIKTNNASSVLVIIEVHIHTIKMCFYSTRPYHGPRCMRLRSSITLEMNSLRPLGHPCHCQDINWYVNCDKDKYGIASISSNSGTYESNVFDTNCETFSVIFLTTLTQLLLFIGVW